MRLLIMRAPHRIAPAMMNGEAKNKHSSSAGPMVNDTLCLLCAVTDYLPP